MSSNHVWQSGLYDSKLGFVSDLGKGVVEWLAPQQGERILDLGCGTGDLAYDISRAGAIVTGMDLSEAMIEKARDKYPDIRFVTGDAEQFRFAEPFDAVFSNAALHWMKNAGQVAECVWHALKPGGRFVAEFGGRGNVGKVVKAIGAVLEENYGIDASALHPWYFPSIGEYSSLLERQGFHVAFAVHFDRPTPLPDGEEGLRHWLRGFAGGYFESFSEAERSKAFADIAAKARDDLFRDDSWRLDYKRIRIKAVKPSSEAAT